MPSTQKLTVTVSYKNGGSLYVNVPATITDPLELYVGLNTRLGLLLRFNSEEMASFERGEQVSFPELVVVKS